MAISPQFTSRYAQEWTITFLQCYPNGMLKYTDLCNLLQLTAGAHADLGGLSYRAMQRHHQAWVLSRMRVEINALPRWQDTVTVKTWIHALENSRSTRCLELWHGDEKWVSCETYWAVLNTQTRRPDTLALPNDHFVRYDERATALPTQKIVLPSKLEPVENYRIRVSDLDIVNHVNNVKYLEWCLNHCDPHRLFEGRLRAFDMNFMREMHLGQEAEIGHHEGVFVVSHEGKNCFALAMDWVD